MKRAIYLITLMLLISGGTIALGLCLPDEDLSVESDSTGQDTLIARSGSYDPCDNYLTWTDRFYRTGVARGYTLRFHYNGTNEHHGYYSYDYHVNQWHEFTATVYVGPSTNHEIVFSKSNYSYGAFGPIYARAIYSASGGSSPEP